MVAVETQTKYEVLKSLGDDFVRLVRLGIISLKVLDQKVFYEAYLKQRENHIKSVAITYISDEYGISERQLYTIIKEMEREV